MIISESCSKCLKPAIRLIGTTAYCWEHAEMLLAPMRARWGVVKELREGWVTCVQCGAEWEGLMKDGCPWCIRNYWRRRDNARERLLHPIWLGKEPQSQFNWGEQLAQAEAAGLITQDELEKALATHERSKRGI